MPGGLRTDLYELNMAAAYLRRGMSGPATFSLFVRALPPERGFLVCAGLEACLEALEHFSFEPDDLAYCREVLGYDPGTVRAFAALRFTGDVWAVPEGRVVFAGEPLLEVTAPIAEAQLVETVLLNHLTFHTTVASKAARCRIAARGRELVDFAFRRTQGLEAAMTVARAGAMVGFAATSNVEAARRFGLRAAGTMAHSFVQAFPSELEAFRAFATDFPDRTTFLVDTYDTEAGVRHAVRVISELGLAGRPSVGVRLDSGDLASLARQARQILDEAGLVQVRIFASGGLDEYAIEDLLSAGAPIDAFGVGTRVGVSADAPYLDTAYKLVAYGGRPVVKLSPDKQTWPGAKQVYRRPGLPDLVTLREEDPPPGSEPLLVQVMRGGRRCAPPSPLAEARARFEADLAALPPSATRIRNPQPPPVEHSEALRRLAAEARALAQEASAQTEVPP